MKKAGALFWLAIAVIFVVCLIFSNASKTKRLQELNAKGLTMDWCINHTWGDGEIVPSICVNGAEKVSDRTASKEYVLTKFVHFYRMGDHLVPIICLGNRPCEISAIHR